MLKLFHLWTGSELYTIYSLANQWSWFLAKNTINLCFWLLCCWDDSQCISRGIRQLCSYKISYCVSIHCCS
jgi:hypothetical protein